ncbi:hypothetical protein [Microbacterium oleivorans]|uniref:Uncharacterized protein n=1 Tax=Microbacterium oleivorans TaxID=273677 RepID=A0A177KDK5_9MICO|nr:hypothetical protein [Microbacterium oleivorans]OAH51488.1 hypothetical protein AYL44_04365 [Microbacterium oleivorans]
MSTIAASTAHRLRAYRLVTVSDRVARVVDGSGRVIGHVARTGDGDGCRYRARRYRAAAGGFVDVGEFWRVEDAVAALHDSR